MSGPRGAAVAEPTEDQQSRTAWVLAIPVGDPGAGGLVRRSVAGGDATRAFIDGYLVDRIHLSKELGLPSDSDDAALVLGAYQRWGKAALARLRGCFLVAILDPQRELALVARDPLGSHPVFFAEANGIALFATWPEALLSQPGVSRSLNPAAMADHLCSRWPDRFETFYRQIRRLPSGWSVVITDGRLSVQRYWDPVPEIDAEIDWLTEEETNRFGDVLDRAVSRCLEVGRVGIFLSGGFDSVSIAAVASDTLQKSGRHAPVALSLRFPDPTCDEEPVQRGVARSLGMPLRLVNFDEAVGPRGLVAEAVDLSRELPFPLFNCWAPAFLEVARRGRAEGVGTILTGSGGDEWLGVTPLLAADLMQKGDVLGLLRLMRMWHRSYEPSWWISVRGTLWRFGLRPLLGQMLYKAAPTAWNRNRMKRAVSADPDWIAPDPALRREMLARAEGHLVDSAPRGGFYARDSRETLDHPMMSTGLEEQFFFGQRLGIRYQHPYWDPDLASQIYRTRPEDLIRGGRSKGLVRETVAKRFPALGFERQRKVSAQDYFQQILAREGPPAARSIGDLSALAEVGVIEPRRVRSFLAHAFDRVSRSQEQALHLFCVEAWTRKQLGTV